MIQVQQRIRKVLPAGGFARSVAVIAGGTALAQAIAVAVSPILSRLYSPSDFGVLAVYTSVLSVLSVIASLRYEQAIPLPDDDNTAVHLVLLSFSIVAPVGLFVGLCVWLWPNQLVTWLNTPGLKQYLWMLPFAFWGLGSYQIFTYWATRRSKFHLIARTNLLQQIWGQLVTSVPLGIVHAGALGLLAGYSAIQITGALSLARSFWSERRAFGVVVINKMRQAAVDYRKFPCYTVWASLISTLGLQMPVVFLTHYFSAGTAGYYSLALRVLGLPTSLLGQAIAQVFYPKAAKVAGTEELPKLTERLAVALFTLSVPIFGVVMAAGPKLFVFVFGARWGTAGLYSQILAPWFLVLLVSSPLSVLSLVKGKQSLALGITVLELALRLGSLWLGGTVLNTASSTLGLLALAGVVISLMSILVMTGIVGCRPFYILGTSIKSTWVAAPVLLALWACSRLLAPMLVTGLAGLTSLLLFVLFRNVLRTLTVI